MKYLTLSLLSLAVFASCSDLAEKPHAAPASPDATCAAEIIVLGAGQDAGAPQIGNKDDPAWQDPALRQTASSIALIDHTLPARYLFDAAPHITEQLQMLDRLAPKPGNNLGLDGVFLTHAHIGHYTGLMFFGREAASTSGLPVYAMPRMADFLRENGPWSQLVALGNIDLTTLANSDTVTLSNYGPHVTPFRVPHRDEYSETVGFLIDTDEKTVAYLPDIDNWDGLEAETGQTLVDLVKHADIAFLDASFFDDNELPGRDMSLIPHPRVTETMDRLQALPAEIRARVHFIHYNHTNPIRFTDTEETSRVEKAGFNIARAGDRFCLSEP